MSIYKTAAMSLLTGILGSGKTMRAVQLMDGAVKEGEKVYQCGFKGINVEGVIDWEDPRKWQELPPGAILFVDEAQKWFGERRSGHAPDYLKAMNTMRGEEGVRMVLLTQHPKYLDSHIKDLVGCHEHLLRESGKLSSKLWRCDEIMEDPRSPRGRSKADVETFKIPVKEYGDKIVSANSPHTIKYRMPALLKKAILIGGLGALFLGGTWFFVVKGALGDRAKANEKAAGGAGSPTATLSAGRLSATSSSGRGASGSEGARPKWESEVAYATDHLPRFGTMPWTAPVFDSRAPVAKPELYCMSSLPSPDEPHEPSCTCLTEQGTTYDLTQAECRRVARFGVPYNPYKEGEDREGRQGPEQTASESELPISRAASVVSGSMSTAGNPANVVEAPAPHF